MLPDSIDDSLGYYPDSELVFGIVSPIGVDYRPVVDSLQNYLGQFGYVSKEVKVSSRFEELAKQLKLRLKHPADGDRKQEMWRKIEIGDQICKAVRRKDFHALLANALIMAGRPSSSNTDNPPPSPKTAHIIISLKRPQEVSTLRRVYGPGFYLIGIAANDEARDRFFDERGFSADEQAALIECDAAEKGDFGQRTRDTFYLSDCFISLDDHSRQVARFLDLVFGCPFNSPTFEERSMYLAYAASLTSSDLARQVGSALMDEMGDCLGLGWNDVPKPMGGLYGPEPDAKRDTDLGEDSNDTEKIDMASAIVRALTVDASKEAIEVAARQLLASSGFFDITEFGRAVHAEMAALLACARTGRSPVGSTLFVTTFPCHNCTRHIIASGIRRVYYIEPYIKSKAVKLHGDACTESVADEGKIPFLPFIGIGPRRYLDLFSMSLGTGYPIERKKNGKKIPWDRPSATPRLQMAPVSYLIREKFASTRLNELLSAEGQHKVGSGASNGRSGTTGFVGADQ